MVVSKGHTILVPESLLGDGKEVVTVVWSQDRTDKKEEYITGTIKFKENGKS
jgi:hypothetical protein